jgi:hypothetical protein
MKHRRTVGRPPAGFNGEPASEYPQLGARVPPATLDCLRAIATREGRPIWRVLVDAIETYDRDTRLQTRPGGRSRSEIPAPAVREFR